MLFWPAFDVVKKKNLYHFFSKSPWHFLGSTFSIMSYTLYTLFKQKYNYETTLIAKKGNAHCRSIKFAQVDFRLNVANGKSKQLFFLTDALCILVAVVDSLCCKCVLASQISTNERFINRLTWRQLGDGNGCLSFLKLFRLF